MSQDKDTNNLNEIATKAPVVNSTETVESTSPRSPFSAGVNVKSDEKTLTVADSASVLSSSSASVLSSSSASVVSSSSASVASSTSSLSSAPALAPAHIGTDEAKGVAEQPKATLAASSDAKRLSLPVRAFNSASAFSVSALTVVGNVVGGLLTFVTRTAWNGISFVPDVLVQLGREDTRAEFKESKGFVASSVAVLKALFKSVWQSIKSVGVHEAGAINASYKVIKGENLEDKNDLSNSKVNVLSLKNLLGATTAVSRMITDVNTPNEPTAKVAHAICNYKREVSPSK